MTNLEQKARELLPCPFCGETGDGSLNGNLHFVTDDRQYRHRVKCFGCFAEGPSGRSTEEASSEWNTRAIQSALTTAGEREAIVAWLRDDAAFNEGEEFSPEDKANAQLFILACRTIANAIEAGTHLSSLSGPTHDNGGENV